MKLIMTLLVRDEEDIIEENILFHLSQGIDFIIVMDNLSVDSTADILKKYQRQGKLHYIYQPEDNYNQHKWVTAMARLAFEQYGANWVINNDADEFWIARKGDLKTTLSLLESSINAVKAQRFNFPLAIHEVENENKPFYEHMIYQETASLNPLGEPLPPKVLHRGHSKVVVAQGNHDVDIPDKKMVDGSIDIYHFPLRTKKQFINKIAKGGQAYQNNHELPLGMGSTWRSLYRSLVNEGNINDYLSSEILEKKALNEKLVNEKLVKNTFLQRFFRENSLMSSKVLICTGFHRSATSVTANYLNSAGLNLGANLMAGGISNAKGHFEDWGVVQLHNDLLEESSTDWQFHDECKLESDIEGFQEYVKKRSSQFDQWGVKDPRACLFLDNWNEVLGDSGRYLFIVRHWSSCIESLLHRHSREFAHKMGDVDANHAGIKLWLDVSLAAKMWLSYNKRLLDFATRNNEKVLLVTQRALFEGAPVLDYLNDKFGFNLNTEVNSPFDPYLLRDQANQSIYDTLSYSLRVQLDQVHNDLLSLCQFKSSDEEPVYIKVNQLTENELIPLYEAMKRRLELSAMKDISTTEINAVTWLEKLTLLVDAEQVIQQCNSISQPILNGLNITKFQVFLDEKFNLNGDVLLAFAKLLVRKKEYELAINYFQRAVTTGVYFPFMDMFIGQCYQALSFNVEAEFFFDKAIKANPNNAIFYTNKAKFLVSVNKLDEAKTAFELGYEKGMNKPVNVLPYCDYLIQHNQEIQAKQLLQALVADTNNAHAKTRLTQLILSDNFNLGKIHYLEAVKANITGKNRYNWLAELCSLLDFGASENDLIQRIYLHWKEVDEVKNT